MFGPFLIYISTDATHTPPEKTEHPLIFKYKIITEKSKSNIRLDSLNIYE